MLINFFIWGYVFRFRIAILAAEQLCLAGIVLRDDWRLSGDFGTALLRRGVAKVASNCGNKSAKKIYQLLVNQQVFYLIF
jgi:hypothetical protein